MTSLQPFAFEREFGEDAAAPTTAVDELAEALASAEARGFAAGQAAALARFRAERDTSIAAALEALVTALDTADGQLAGATAGVEAEATALAVAAAELLAGHAIAERPAGAVQEVLARLLGELRRGMPIELWVHPELVAEIEKLVIEVQRGERRQRPILIKSDPALALGDGRVSWDQGGALIDATARRAVLERALVEMAQAH